MSKYLKIIFFRPEILSLYGYIECIDYLSIRQRKLVCSKAVNYYFKINNNY